MGTAIFGDMRFGIDVAQQRMAFDEVVDRVRFGRKPWFRRGLGIRPFRADVRRRPGRVLRRHDDTRRPRHGDEQDTVSGCSSPV